MEKQGLAANVIAKIRERKLNPLPKWRFWLKNNLLWFLSGISLLLSSWFLAASFYLTNYGDWQFHSQIAGNWFKFFFISLPYFWLILLVIFIFIFDYNIKHTKKGYRYPLWKVSVFALIASLLLGFFFFKIGLGQAANDVASRDKEFYSNIANPRVQFWNQPDEGRLAGLVIEKKQKDNIIVVDIKEKKWELDTSRVKENEQVIIQVGLPIKVLGEKTDRDSFSAVQVMPAGPEAMFIKRHSNKPFVKPGFSPDHLKKNNPKAY
jgi:uncharacterized membrane protein